MKVLILHPLGSDNYDQIAARFPDVNMIYRPCGSQAEVSAALEPDVEVILGNNHLPSPEEVPHLKFVQLCMAGVDGLTDHPLYRSNRIAFATASGVHAVGIAEYIMAHMLMHAHKLRVLYEMQSTQVWPTVRERFGPAPLHGQSLAIIGYGTIGRHLARLASAFGMRIRAVKRRPDVLADPGYVRQNTGDPDGRLAEIYPPQDLHRVLAQSDYIALTLPLTAETNRLLDQEALRAVKRGAYLINVSRGKHVDHDALADALKSGQLSGASLDVFDVEPLPPGHPAWTLPGVTTTPHISGVVPDYLRLVVEIFSENMDRYRSGTPLLNLVDRSLGY